jgi:hypothetical protein
MVKGGLTHMPHEFKVTDRNDPMTDAYTGRICQKWRIFVIVRKANSELPLRIQMTRSASG